MVSVCIATYNGSKYLKEQIFSILSQLSENDEIIVSDDNSKDDTRKILLSFEDNRIKIFDGPCAGNAAFNFENALKNASGDYIFLSDQDDVWMDGKVKTMMEYLLKYDLVLSDCSITDKDLNVVQKSYFSILPPHYGVFANLFKNHYLGCCMAFRRKVLHYALPFPKTIVMHDIWLGLCAELFCKTYIIERPLMYYRRHDLAISTAAGKSKNSLFFKIKYRVSIIYQLYKRKIRLLGSSDIL